MFYDRTLVKHAVDNKEVLSLHYMIQQVESQTERNSDLVELSSAALSLHYQNFSEVS